MINRKIPILILAASILFSQPVYADMIENNNQEDFTENMEIMLENEDQEGSENNRRNYGNKHRPDSVNNDSANGSPSGGPNNKPSSTSKNSGASKKPDKKPKDDKPDKKPDKKPKDDKPDKKPDKKPKDNKTGKKPKKNPNNNMDVETVSKMLDEEKELIEDQTAGEDYSSHQAFTIVDTEEDAEEVARQYGGNVSNYENGVAIIEFDKTLDEVLDDVDVDSQSINSMIHPDYFMNVDSITVNDPSFNTQYFHKKINDSEIWDITEGEGSVVAVIDTGVDSDHPDLAGNIKSLKYTNNVSTYEDSDGHGTHTAGLVGAIANNSKGGAGVAPETKLEIIRVGTSKTITISSMIQGINKAVEDDVDVINLSLGIKALNVTTAVKNQIQDSIDEAYENGITVVASAGNDSSNAKVYPAALDHVISVAASDSSGSLGWYSNYGDWIDIVAPGSSVYSTYLNGSYSSLSGTSMSSPIVAGAAALIYSSNPELQNNKNSDTADKVAEILTSATDGKTYTYTSGSVTRSVKSGCLDLTKAITREEPDVPVNDPTDNPTKDPTEDPTEEQPTEENPVNNNPDKEPTEEPSEEPSEEPIEEPSEEQPEKPTEEQPEDEPATEPIDESQLISRTVSAPNGAVIKYEDNIPFTGKKLKAKDIDISISFNGAAYKVKSVKIKNGKHAGTATIIIKKLDSADKTIRDALKGYELPYVIHPLEITAEDTYIKVDNAGNITGVKVLVNRKLKKVSQSMWKYENGILTFSGDYTGAVNIAAPETGEN